MLGELRAGTERACQRQHQHRATTSTPRDNNAILHRDKNGCIRTSRKKRITIVLLAACCNVVHILMLFSAYVKMLGFRPTTVPYR
ncbi:hypothetical protein GMOD_00002482 [Pyrenophora seminiperda CCB06]|uniref:Uncharacterized protein n=1 Tax=Pyrenophora seminiperda CCB06 TaxID=1302712 RepID=A0A3M7M2D6_9PLEO|nr:hypothetical protein GMOD_00002482 [Pyrenophora seminiperda CCB06]